MRVRKFGFDKMMSQKEEELLCLLSAPVVDLWKLREHALSEDGLVNGKYFKVLLQAVLPVVTTPRFPQLTVFQFILFFL